MTLGVVYSLHMKGPLLVMLDKCSQEQRRLIRQEFGPDRVVLHVGEKWMNGSLHISEVLEKMVVPFAQRLREAQGKPAAKCLYMFALQVSSVCVEVGGAL